MQRFRLRHKAGAQTVLASAQQPGDCKSAFPPPLCCGFSALLCVPQSPEKRQAAASANCWIGIGRISSGVLATGSIIRMAAYLLKAVRVDAVAADQDHVHRGLHVVAETGCAGAKKRRTRDHACPAPSPVSRGDRDAYWTPMGCFFYADPKHSARGATKPGRYLAICRWIRRWR